MGGYALFFIINMITVNISIFIGVPGKTRVTDPVMVIMYTVSAFVVLFQYPFLFRIASWWKRTGIFYLSMFIFLFIIGLVFSWNQDVGSHAAGTILALLDGITRMVIFGHVFGIWFLPIVISVNWLFKRWLF
jgi:hypothetical protein